MFLGEGAKILIKKPKKNHILSYCHLLPASNLMPFHRKVHLCLLHAPLLRFFANLSIKVENHVLSINAMPH